MATESPDTPVENFVPSDALYYDNGDIALVSSDGVVYRLYSGILTQFSPVFKGMLESQDTTAQGEMYGGCPVVRMSEDSQCLDVFLPMIFKSPSFRKMSEKNLEAVLIALPLAHKFLMDDISAPLQSIVSTLFLSNTPDLTRTSLMWACMEIPMKNVVDCILALELIGSDGGLPAAYYVLATYHPTVVTRALTPPHHNALDIATRVIEGRDRIRYFWFNVVRDRIMDVVDARTCAQPASCAAETNKLLARHRQMSENVFHESENSRVDIKLMIQQLFPSERPSLFGQPETLRCSQCSERYEGKAYSTQKVFVELLPTYFGLRGWD